MTEPASETERLMAEAMNWITGSAVAHAQITINGIAGTSLVRELRDALRASDQRIHELSSRDRDFQTLLDFQMKVVVALQRETGTRFEDVPQHIRDLVQRAETLQQTLRTLIVEWNTRAGLSSIRLQGHTLRDCADGLAAALARVGDLPCSYCQHSHAVHTPVGCVWNCDCAGYERLAPAGPVRQE